MNILPKDILRKKKFTRTEFLKQPRLPLHIVFDSPKSAVNIGSLFRIADMVRASKLHICNSHLSPPNRKIRLTSQGTEKWVEWQRWDSTVECLNYLHSQKIKICALELTTQSKLYNTLDWEFPLAILVGREDDGISEEALQLVDYACYIEMFGMGNSLNAAMACSIVSYYVLEQYLKSNTFI